MQNIHTIILTFSNGYVVDFLDIISIIALLFGIYVIINKNPIASLISLIGLFATISIYLTLLGLTFIGLSYLIVYIGAVSILFLFILMLIDIRTSELQSNNKNSIPLGLFITILLNYILFLLLPYSIAILNNFKNRFNNLIYGLSYKGNYTESSNFLINKNKEDINNIYIKFVSSNNWDGNMTETSHISTIGNILYTSYNIWIFIASLILVLVMVGAIIITIKKDTETESAKS